MIPDAVFEQMLPIMRRDEGWKLLPYKDSVGVLTIGCGHNLSVPISNAAVRQILRDDLASAWVALGGHAWFQALDDVRRGALLNMAFNLGMGGLLGFRKFLAALTAQDWEQAAIEMLDSTWAGQVGPRAHRLAAQIRTGTWQ